MFKVKRNKMLLQDINLHSSAAVPVSMLFMKTRKLFMGGTAETNQYRLWADKAKLCVV